MRGWFNECALYARICYYMMGEPKTVEEIIRRRTQCVIIARDV